MRQGTYVCNGVKYTTGAGIKIKRSSGERFYTDAWFRFYEDESDYVTYDIMRADSFLLQTVSLVLNVLTY